jgi:putative peptidoglycan lipid II flippase
VKPIRLVYGVLTVGFWTLMSRVLGLLREIILFGVIGPGPVMDAFVAAFRLPNMFRRFFAEGAFNAAFVPMFSKKYQAGDDPNLFASDALNGLALVLLALTAVAMIFMPALVWATAGGFGGTERFDLAVGFGRIMFPYIFFISLAALFSGVLNAGGHFAAAAAAPVVLNILVIAALITAKFTGGQPVLYLVWSVPVAGIAQLALVWHAALRAGLRLRLGRPRWTKDMRRLVVIAVPAALAGGVMQINLVVGQQVASSFDKAVGWLYGADRLYQLPLGVVGIAIGIVLLPDLSRKLKANDTSGARAAFSRAAEISLALTLPAAVALCVIPLPLVSVLFERGATTAADSAAMAQAVAIYGLGLPAFMLQKLLQPLFFAREDTRTPFRYAVVSMIVNAALAIGLIPMFGWLAPAIATSAAGWAMVGLLALGARRFGREAQFDARLRTRLWRILAASAAMGVVLFLCHALAGSSFRVVGWRYLALSGLILAGIVSYVGVAQVLGAFKISEYRAALRRSSE